MPEHLEQAHDGQVPDVGEETPALGLEPVAAEAEHLDGARTLAEVVDEVARVEVARGLTARDEHSPGRRSLWTRCPRRGSI